MNFKFSGRRLIIFLILFFVGLSIACFSQDSTFTLQSNEMRFFVKKALEAKAYKAISDSSEKQIQNLERKIYNDSTQIKSCGDLLTEKDKSVAIVTKLAESYKEEVKKETWWKNFWRYVAEGLAILGGGYVIFDQATE